MSSNKMNAAKAEPLFKLDNIDEWCNVFADNYVVNNPIISDLEQMLGIAAPPEKKTQKTPIIQLDESDIIAEEKSPPLWTAICNYCGWQKTAGFPAETEVDAAMLANNEHLRCRYRKSICRQPTIKPLKMAHPLEEIPTAPAKIWQRYNGAEMLFELGVKEIDIQETKDYAFYCAAIHELPPSDSTFIFDEELDN